MVTKIERDAWTFIYRLYEEFAEPLRKADSEEAAAIFTKAVEKLRQCAGFNEEAQKILFAGYDLLDSVWKSRKQ